MKAKEKLTHHPIYLEILSGDFVGDVHDLKILSGDFSDFYVWGCQVFDLDVLLCWILMHPGCIAVILDVLLCWMWMHPGCIAVILDVLLCLLWIYPGDFDVWRCDVLAG